jgi:hypothetical protein
VSEVDGERRARMKRKMVAALAGAAGLGVAGTAWGVIPDGDGTFHGCVNRATGLVRVVDPDRSGSLGRCISTGPALLRETPIEWGDARVGGDVFTAFGGGVNLDEQEYALAMDLPAGAFEVAVSFQLENDRPDQTLANQPLVTCRVSRAGAESPSYEIRQSVPPGRGMEFVSGTFAFDVNEPWTLQLRCPRISGFVLHMSKAALNAQTVDRIIAG